MWKNAKNMKECKQIERNVKNMKERKEYETNVKVRLR